MIDQTALFEARTAGYHNYRVPGIVCTERGVVIASVEARRQTGSDWSDNDILLRRSMDGGDGWLSPQLVVAQTDYGDGPISNFVMIPDVEGILHALFCHNYARLFYMYSDDDGLTFSRPAEITVDLEALRQRYPWRVIATGPGHGIQLTNGRLVVPVWMSTGETSEFGAGKLGHRPSDVASIYSDDHGLTWQCGETVVVDRQIVQGEMLCNPSETVTVELRDGRVLFNIRSESAPGRRLVAVSPDGATNWQIRGWDEALLEPVCMGSIVRGVAESAGGIPPILFANPNNLENELTSGRGHLNHDRKRLTVKLSEDDGRTWSAARVLEPGPSGYSDMATASDGTVLCIYEDGMFEAMTDTRFITVARFDMDWLRKSVAKT